MKNLLLTALMLVASASSFAMHHEAAEDKAAKKAGHDHAEMAQEKAESADDHAEMANDHADMDHGDTDHGESDADEKPAATDPEMAPES